MLGPVSHRGSALPAQAPKLSSARAGDDGVRLLGHAILERSGAFEHEAARSPRKTPHEALETDERGRTVAAVHHQVFDMPLTRDVARECLRDGGASEPRRVLPLTIGLLIPALDDESRV